MKRLASPRALAAALLTVLTLSFGLAAGDSLAAPRRGDHPGKGLDAVHAHALAPMFHLRGLARLRDELKLDAQQEALWKETRDFVREQRDAMRERSRREYAETRTLLDQPGADLRAVVKRMDELRSESLKQHEAVRERCLAVYDSLSAEQKEKVRLFFKAGMERGGKDGKRPGRGHPRQDKRQRHAPAPARE